MTPTGRASVGRSIHPAVSASEIGGVVVRLPISLAIALWLVCAMWAVAIVTYIFDFPSEIVWLCLTLGIVIGVLKLVARQNSE
jgi:hypothetical protein